MLALMNKVFETKHKNVSNAYDILITLQELYNENKRVVEYELCVLFFSMILKEILSSDNHVIKMINGIRQLDVWGVVLPDCVKVNLILQSLPPSYKLLITNYGFN